MTTTAAGRQWVKHEGALPKGFDKIPLGGQGLEKPRPGFQSGTVWKRTGSGEVYRCDPLPLPARTGAGGVGDVSGDAVVISAPVADTAVTDSGGLTHDGFYSATPPADVEQALNPNGISAGAWTEGPVFAQYKSPPNAEVWRFSNPEGYAQGKGVNQGVLSPVPGTPGGGAGGSSGNSTLSKAVPVVVAIAAVTLLGVGVYAAVQHGKKGARTNPAGHHKRLGGPRRDSHGRFR